MDALDFQNSFNKVLTKIAPLRQEIAFEPIGQIPTEDTGGIIFLYETMFVDK